LSFSDRDLIFEDLKNYMTVVVVFVVVVVVVVVV